MKHSETCSSCDLVQRRTRNGKANVCHARLRRRFFYSYGKSLKFRAYESVSNRWNFLRSYTHHAKVLKGMFDYPQKK